MQIHSLAQLGSAIRARRLELGLTQAALAERADVSRRWVYEFEAGKARAEVGLLLLVLDALDLRLILDPEGEGDADRARARASGASADRVIDLDEALERYRGDDARSGDGR